MRKIALIVAATVAAAVVHGAGIDAEYVAVTKRVLPDGNVIEHRARGRFAQDDEGRTRFEIDDRTSIVDPVEGVMWTVDDRFHQAYRVRIDGSSTFPSREDNTGSIGDLAAAGLSEAVPPDGPPVDRETESLGTAVINGMASTGELHRRTIPTGAIGNAQPIVVEMEVWRSGDFGFDLPVRTVVRDPLHGESVQELRNVKALEDAATKGLFRPVDGMTVVDAPAPPYDAATFLEE